MAIIAEKAAETGVGEDARTTAGLPPQRRRPVVGDPGLETGATLRGAVPVGSGIRLNCAHRLRDSEARLGTSFGGEFRGEFRGVFRGVFQNRAHPEVI